MKSTDIIILVTCFLLLRMCMGSTTPNECPEKCTCDTVRMRCENVIPRTAPNNINEIVLSLLNSSFLSPGIFCNVSWNGVTKLSIQDTGNQTFFLDNYIFICLKQIQVLKLYTKNSFNATNNALCGLDNVTVLDVSGCDRLRTQQLVLLLSGNTSVANLKKLILSNTGHILEGIDLSQNLIDALSDKDITELDLSKSTVLASYPILDGICDTLRKLNLSNSVFESKTYLLLNRTCRSLRNLDFNALSIPHNIPHNVSCINTVLNLPSQIFSEYQFFQYLDILNVSRVTFNDQFIYLKNCSIKGLPITLNWKEIHFSGYNIPAADVEIHKILDKLQYIDLSDNKIETTAPNSLKSFKHLIKLDVSKNKLSQTHLFDGTFSVLFQYNVQLEEISLKDNGLRYLPSTTFAFNIYLTRIDISSNLFTQITFNVSHLINLDTLDMRNNSVEHLDEFSRRALDSLYEKHQSRNNRTKQTAASTFLIDLRSNPFSCECESLQFVKWFVSSPIFTATRHQYYCKAGWQEIEMNSKAIEAAEDDCERAKRKLRKLLLSTVISTTAATLLLLVIIYVVKRYRKRKFYQRLEDQVGLLHGHDVRFRFPVFVSYSSDDSEFVLSNVLNPLKREVSYPDNKHIDCSLFLEQNITSYGFIDAEPDIKFHLQRIADTDRELVCVGDRYFRLGRSIFSEIITCLQGCAVVVVVMSRNYCKSDYCKLEIEQSRLMRKPIIIIVKEEVEEEEMNAVTKEIFRHFTRIGFIMEDGQVRLQRDWEDVCLSIIQLL